MVQATTIPTDPDTKIRFLIEGLRTSPEKLDKYGDPLFQKELIRHFLRQKEWEKAHGLIPEQMDYGKPGWHHILFARAYDSAGDKDKALSHWRQFAAFRPEHQEARAALEGRYWPANLPQPFRLIVERVPQQDLSVIFDIGANRGQSCSAYTLGLPLSKIYAFEPVPATFDFLSNAIRSHPNIEAHNIALSDARGTVDMTNSGTSTMNRISSASNALDTVAVEADTVKSFCVKHDIRRINFMKIDTEGHDLSVLRGCGDFLHGIDFVQCEASANIYNKFHNSFVDIFEHMTTNGFYLFHVGGLEYEHGGGGYPILRRFDPVFVNERIVGPLNGVRCE